MNNGGMPNKNTYLAICVISILINLIFGIFNVIMYRGMTAAIDSGDYASAWGKAKAIKIASAVGLAILIMIPLLR